MSETDSAAVVSETDPAAVSPAPPLAETVDWKAEAGKWKNLSRVNEDAKKQNKAESDRLNAELGQERARFAAAELAVAADRATDRLHIRLARAGIDEETAIGFLNVIDTSKLLRDGNPSDEAIEAAATAFAKNRGIVKFDPDQGSKDTGAAKQDMNALIRAAVRGT